MAVDKYLADVAGQRTEKTPAQSSAGVADAGKIVALNSAGNIDSTMLPPGVEIETQSVVSSEALAAGNFVNIYSNAGTLNVRKADASTVGKEANGFVLSAYTIGQSAVVYRKGFNTQLSGLTIGTAYYLSTTAGGVASAAPAGSGNVVQLLGKADSASELYFVERDTLVKA